MQRFRFIAYTFGLCPMCKTNIVNAENAAELSQTVDAAVLALLIPTILIISCLVRLVFKYSKDQHEQDPSTLLNQNNGLWDTIFSPRRNEESEGREEP